MKKFNKGSKVWIVLPWGIFKGKVINTAPKIYKVRVVETGGRKKRQSIYEIEYSRVYAWNDFTRACNLFRGLYL